MLNDVVEFLDRERNYLMEQSGPAFLRQLAAYVGAVCEEPLVAELTAELREQLEEEADAYVRHDEELVPALVKLRNKLVELAPDADDSDKERPGPEAADRLHWYMTLASFDSTVEHGPPKRYPIDPTGSEDRSQSGHLINILRGRIHELQHLEEDDQGLTKVLEENQRPELDELRDRVSELAGEHTRVHRDFVNKIQVHPGVALLRLEGCVADFNPPPPPKDETPEEEQHRMSMLLLKASTQLLFADALYNTGSSGLSGEKARELEELIDDQLRPLVDRLHHGLRGLAGRRRSYSRLLLRFKARCEMHDAEALCKLAEAKTRQAELRLTAAAARFFFDQGLTPLTETVVSKLRTDVLDPFADTTFYIEAKQVHDGTKDPGGAIREGAWQLYNTLRRMKGEPFTIREVFLLVFRRGGPDIELPGPYPVEDWMIYPMLVDIAPPDVSGSRQEAAPIKLSVEDLAPQPAQAAEPATADENPEAATVRVKA